MSDNNEPTKFRLDLPGFELEVSGSKAFVEELYHRVSHDILPWVFPGEVPFQAEVVPDAQPEMPCYTWIYGCTEFYNKVYAVDDGQIGSGILGPYLKPTALRRIYVDRDDHDLFTALAGSQKTLWAEFTPEGLDRIR